MYLAFSFSIYLFIYLYIYPSCWRARASTRSSWASWRPTWGTWSAPRCAWSSRWRRRAIDTGTGGSRKVCGLQRKSTVHCYIFFFSPSIYLSIIIYSPSSSCFLSHISLSLTLHFSLRSKFMFPGSRTSERTGSWRSSRRRRARTSPGSGTLRRRSGSKRQSSRGNRYFCLSIFHIYVSFYLI